MTERPSWAPDSVDLDVPSAARVYDYLLGGAHNFASDRQLAEQILRVQPHARTISRLNRAFLRRAVLLLLEQGVRQFLDLGAGMPTVGNVHEIVERVSPGCRVVYVDREDVAVAHSTLLLEDHPRAGAVKADLTRPEEVLTAAETRRLLDFDQPVGLLMVAVLHLVSPEQDPVGVIGRYRDAVAPGSWLVLSQFTSDMMTEEMAGIVEVMKQSRDRIYPRSRSEITDLFTGFGLVEPGVVPTALWRPDAPVVDSEEVQRSGILAGVGRKP